MRNTMDQTFSSYEQPGGRTYCRASPGWCKLNEVGTSMINNSLNSPKGLKAHPCYEGNYNENKRMSYGENLYSPKSRFEGGLPKEKLDQLFFRIPTGQRTRNKSSTMGAFGSQLMTQIKVTQSPDAKNLQYWNVANQRYDVHILKKG